MKPTPVWVLGSGPEAERHAQAWKKLGDRVELHRLPVQVTADDLKETTPRAASVCLPVDQRIKQCRILLEAGCHVLCAAPIALDTAEAHDLVATVHHGKARFTPAHPLLYAPGMVRLMAYVYARRLGSVQNVFTYRYGPNGSRLLYEPENFDTAWELSSQAALTKTLCLLPEARATDLQCVEQAGEFWLSGRTYYDDDILATVRCDPTVFPPRRGVMVTFSEAVLQWELTETEESLVLLRGSHRRDIPLEGGGPYHAMVERLMKTVTQGATPYEDETGALRALALESIWRTQG